MTAPHRILIVEDERIIARALQRKLIRFGYEVVDIVGTGEEAIEIATREHPDLILMDIRLKGPIDGTVAAKQISSTQHIPIVFLTAYADDETLEAARASEPFGYVLKPYDERELRVVIEMALYKHAAELERARMQRMETFGQLASGVAHDFNNVMTVILTCCNSLLGHMSASDRGYAQVATIRSIAERTARMTRQLMLFGRNDPGELAPVDLGTLVTSMVPMLTHLLGDTVGLSTQVAPNLQLVMAAPSELERLVMNLVANARDAMPDGGFIRIELANQSDAVRLSIADTGSGMDDATRARIFERFFTTKDEGTGTGLGLATVYAIVERYGGKIDVASGIGVGTTFTVRFPIAPVAAAKSNPSARVSSSAEMQGTVIVVENNEDVRVSVRDILAAAGFEVLEARDGIDALGLCVVHDQIDLVISDLVMPRMNGRELAKKLETVKPSAKLIFMSGYPDSSQGHEPVDAVPRILHKPFTPAELIARVRDAIGVA